MLRRVIAHLGVTFVVGLVEDAGQLHIVHDPQYYADLHRREHQLDLDTLTLHEVLFGAEDRADVQVMQLLVDEVDAELLELVLFEILETENIQQTDRLVPLKESFGIGAAVLKLWRENRQVHLLDEPIEHVVEQSFGERLDRCVNVIRLMWHSAANRFLLVQNLSLELTGVDLQQLSDEIHLVFVLDLNRLVRLTFLVGAFVKIKVADVEAGGRRTLDSFLLLWREPEIIEGLGDSLFFV